MDDPIAPGGARRKTKMLPAGELPEDTIVDILLRLPVKSLVRFRCVCKSWYSLLTSSDFSTKHLEHSRRQFYLLQVDESFEPDIYPSLRIGLDGIRVYQFALAPEYDLDQLVHIDHPRMDDRQIKYLQVIGSIDGLVCISLNFDTYIMMWNPATRLSYQLPSAGIRAMAIGVGRYQNNGYKVVRIVSRKAEVYDSYSRLWHKTADPPNLPFRTVDGCTIANGVPYWLSYCHSVIWFDPIHDMFGTMKLPVGLFEFNSDEDNIDARLELIRGAVAVILLKLNDYDDMVSRDVVNLDVWMMDQPHGDRPISWTKQFRVTSAAVPGVHRWFTCWKDGELVFGTTDIYAGGRKMYMYDRFSDETKRVPGVPVSGRRLRGPDEMFLYKESLISPHPSC